MPSDDLTEVESNRLQEISDQIEQKRAAGKYRFEDFRAALREVLYISKGRGMAEFLYDSVPDPKWLQRVERDAQRWGQEALRQ